MESTSKTPWSTTSPDAVGERADTDEPCIVLVEDDMAIAELIAFILEEHGMRVEIANGGRAGLRMVTERRPDLLITDLHMPDLNGLDLLLATRREQRLKGIPVMIITADMRPEMRQDCLVLGARAYLQKPFDGEELLSGVRHVLGLDADGRPTGSA